MQIERKTVSYVNLYLDIDESSCVQSLVQPVLQQ